MDFKLSDQQRELQGIFKITTNKNNFFIKNILP